MRTQLDLDEFIPTMDTPEKVYQLFDSLGYKVLDSRLKTNPSVYNLPVKEAALVEKIFAVSNYDRRFQILLFKLKEENKEAIRTIPEKILREVDFPFIIFTPDFKTYTFTLVEKVREGPGEFKRKLTKLVVDSTQPYHTDKEILTSLTLSTDTKNPVEVYKLFQNAFSVEKVTKKFFTEYREVFERLVSEVTKQNKHLKFTLFSRDGSVENFVKILLGRLMFLYFIQKRGWLNCFDGWGSGDKKFLFNKFQEAKKDKKNYFKDYLEPLFFDTLNNPRRDKPDQATMFGGRIPFLNGGLFEPEYDYQDVRNHILLENSTFDDVFSVFEKYNFTVKEDEPLEKEVAIDPEMLGKVFENLLEENLRKGKGTYYTPREIVHYMCHESLINYLASEVGIAQEEIRDFLDREQSLEKKETLSSLIKDKAKEIDEKLADIRVLDPACGSGAFLVGMLHEVINARLSLNRELGRSLSEYELKKATIQNNIYGVDIDPGASEIAKLRLWLTLVVDHNLSEIEPLPNLDYKIMVGNSLLDEFMGVKLFNFEKARQQTNGKKILKLFEDEVRQVSMFDDDNKSNILKALQQLHVLYFKESDPVRKKQIKTQIDKIEFDLIEVTVKDEVGKLESQTKQIADKFLYAGVGIPAGEAERISKLSSQQAQILETFNEIKKSNVKPFFLFQLHFSDVFERKGGFDVVIANPPYISAREYAKRSTYKDERNILKRKFTELKGAFDIYIAFILRGLELIDRNGIYSWIIPNKFLLARYSKEVLGLLKNEGLQKILDVSDVHVFENVGVYPIILFGDKSYKGEYVMEEIDNLSSLGINHLIVSNNKKFKSYKTIADFGLKVSSGTTGFQAEQVKSLIREKRYAEKNDIPFVVSGSVDKYSLELGNVRFLNTRYSLPYIHYDSKLLTKEKWEMWLMPKIIIAGMTKHVEATYYQKPVALGVGVYAITDFGNLNPKYVLGLLNSRFLDYFVRTEFKAKHLAGGYLAINKNLIEKFPLVEGNSTDQESIVRLVDAVLTLGSNDSSKLASYLKQIDQLVYKLYNLTPEEIKTIERNAND